MRSLAYIEAVKPHLGKIKKVTFLQKQGYSPAKESTFEEVGILYTTLTYWQDNHHLTEELHFINSIGHVRKVGIQDRRTETLFTCEGIKSARNIDAKTREELQMFFKQVTDQNKAVQSVFDAYEQVHSLRLSCDTIKGNLAAFNGLLTPAEFTTRVKDAVGNPSRFEGITMDLRYDDDCRFIAFSLSRDVETGDWIHQDDWEDMSTTDYKRTLNTYKSHFISPVAPTGFELKTSTNTLNVYDDILYFEAFASLNAAQSLALTAENIQHVATAILNTI